MPVGARAVIQKGETSGLREANRRVSFPCKGAGASYLAPTGGGHAGVLAEPDFFFFFLREIRKLYFYMEPLHFIYAFKF